MNRRAQIGIDRRIDIEWLDAIAARSAAGDPVDAIRTAMWELLDGVVAGDGNDSARRKTITVLMKAWAMPGSPSAPLRMKAAGLLPNATRTERLALHWAILIASYPLFMDVADSVGRISGFHDQFGSAQVTKRMIGLWGDRSTLIRATQRIISSMAQWGALRHIEGAHGYEPVGPSPIRPEYGLVLVHALLLDSTSGSIQLKTIASLPALFPFSVGKMAQAIARDQAFEIHRQGFGDDVVELRNTRQAVSAGAPAVARP